MKRSRFLLGITTALLAIAGIATAKHYGAAVQRWYVTANGIYCAPAFSLCVRNSGFLECTITYTDGSPLHLELTGDLYTRGSLLNGQPRLIAIDNCAHKLVYDGSY